MSPISRSPCPYPLCRPNFTQGHPTSPKVRQRVAIRRRRAAHNRRASTCHPERAVVFATNEGPKLAKPTSPTPIFQVLLQTKHLSNFTQGWPLRHAWVALGSRLGHPRVTQTQSQSQSAEGRNRCFNRRPVDRRRRGPRNVPVLRVLGLEAPSPATVNKRGTAVGNSIFCCKRSKLPSFCRDSTPEGCWRIAHSLGRCNSERDVFAP